MYGVRYSDINYFTREIHIQRQLGRNWLSESNEVAFNMLTAQPLALKTSSSNRVLNIPTLLFREILIQREIYLFNKEKHGENFIDGGYIVCSEKGKPRGRDFLTKPFKTLLQQQNLPNIRWHDLRHTYATLLFQNNVSLKMISIALGHATQIITEQVYVDKKTSNLEKKEELESFMKDVCYEERQIDMSSALACVEHLRVLAE